MSQSSALLGGSIAVGGERVGFSLEYRGRFNSDYQEQSGAAMFNVRF